MSQPNFAVYEPASDGMIRNWLTCGVVPSLLQGLEALIPPDGTPFGACNRWIMSYWAYVQHSIAQEDGVIDFSRFNFNPSLMEGWVYAVQQIKHRAAAFGNRSGVVEAAAVALATFFFRRLDLGRHERSH